MTMTRAAKVNNLTRFAERRDGVRVEYSFSPRQIAKYGRTLPADYAAKFMLSCERETRLHHRDSWADMRASRRVTWTNAAGRRVCKGNRQCQDTQYCRTVR